MKALLGLLGLGPRSSAVDVEPDGVDVRMGWAFHAVIPRSSVAGIARRDARLIARGVHFRSGGRYLVNGSGEGLVTITVAPPLPARMLGFGVTVRELTVSVDDADGLLAALG